MGRYQFLEEVAVADCALDVEAPELHDLFETAASALAELMVEPARGVNKGLHSGGR